MAASSRKSVDWASNMQRTKTSWAVHRTIQMRSPRKSPFKRSLQWQPAAWQCHSMKTPITAKTVEMKVKWNRTVKPMKRANCRSCRAFMLEAMWVLNFIIVSISLNVKFQLRIVTFFRLKPKSYIKTTKNWMMDLKHSFKLFKNHKFRKEKQKLIISL